ncbi:Protein-lysine N-methyltransferase efm6 [Malassezia nana]|uniref:Protein-lysine N-methyltransferase EFM6 n=1 Tax=Malassezia nana TaxID=180528 RepID=A0AAF0ERJ2_9BASI|nr:Protein-lysine N-methyltransferase efm6 [Malassezia nana]
MATRWLFGTQEDELPPSPDLEPTEDVVPEQLPSILGEKTCIVYYTDATRAPTIVEKGAAPPSPPHAYPIYLNLDMSSGCGGKIWPAAEVLGAYIASMPSRYAPDAPDLALERHPWRGKTLVELGSGTGLTGFLIAKLGIGCTTWITDQAPMLPLMAENAQLNPDMIDPCHVAELNWGEPVPDSVPAQPDVLLLADCVYREEAFQPLVDTLAAMSTPTTEILFCYHKRRRADKRFFSMLRRYFEQEDVADDDPARTEAYRRSGTFLMRFHKRA